jgi:3D (Asp-Asp-Asp) domain-containing protein
MNKRMKLAMCLIVLVAIVATTTVFAAESTSNVTAEQPVITTTVSVSYMPGVKVDEFDKTVDYGTLMYEAIQTGTDEALAVGAIYEAQRNLKIVAMGLDYDTTMIFKEGATLDEIRKAYEQEFGTSETTDVTAAMTRLGSYKTTSYIATGNRTASGVWPTAYHTVAVDPKVIPLGTQLYIVFPAPYESMTGYYTAEDTGGAIKGNILDIFMDCSRSEALAYGVQYCEVYRVDN